MSLIFIFLFTSLLQAAQADFVTSEEAFKTNVTLKENKVSVDVQLAKGIYLYQDKVSLSVSPSEYTLEYTLPKATDHEGFDGIEKVYFQALTFDATVAGQALDTSKEFNVTLLFQGCSEQGLCYAPEEKVVTFNAAKNINKVETTATKIEPSIANESSTNEFEAILQKGFFAVIALYFVGGILLAFTPCVFPMIPILSSLIISQGDKITPMRAFFLSLVYVLAMAFAYTIAGVLAGLFGGNLQATMQTPFVIVTFSMVFVALALSMFGFYEIKMPAFIQNAVTKKSQQVEGNGVVGIAIMGFLSALIVGPCMAAPLAGALAYIGDTGDAVLGGVALFSLSMGMGLPLLAVGVGAGKFMPKPGGWMDTVTAVFGVIMLAVAIWMLDRVVEDMVTVLMFGMLLIISSVAFGTFEPIVNSTGAKRFFKGIGKVVFILGVIYFVGAFANGTLFDPLKGFGSKTTVETTQSGVVFTQKVASIEELNSLLTANKGKKVMLDFTASWCTSCKEFDEITLKDQAVITRLSNYVLVKVDITSKTKALEALMKKYGVNTAPGMRFFNESGNEVKAHRINWYQDPTQFLATLAR